MLDASSGVHGGLTGERMRLQEARECSIIWSQTQEARVARRKSQEKQAPKPVGQLTRMEEANVARLGLISIQERIPADFTTWTVNFQVDGRPAKLTCIGSPDVGGVPHGLDGDIATALMDLYVEAGALGDGRIHTTPYQILTRAGLDTSGRYYQILNQTLLRLRSTTYKASEAWRDHGRGRWTTATFNYLADFEYTSDSDQTELSSSSAITIRLADPIVASIRARYTKPLDLEFLTSLERPLTRALYRLIDARRYNPLSPDEPLMEFTVSVTEWAEACKILERKATRVRLQLKSAHDELIERKYLSGAEYTGRGVKQLLTYTFAAGQPRLPDSGLVAALTAVQVSAAVARKLITDLGEEHVQARLAKFHQLMARGYKARSRSALLVDVIKDTEGKYPDEPEGVIPPLERRAAPTYMPSLDEAASDDGPLEAQVEAAMKTLQFLLRERLSVNEYALLRAGLIAGQPDIKTATREAAAAKVSGRLDQYAVDLLTVLHAALNRAARTARA